MRKLSDYINKLGDILEKSDLKDLSFFSKPNGSADQTAMSVNCFESAVYNIIKNSSSIGSEMARPLFLRNIQPTFWYNAETGSFRINNESINLIPIWHKYIKINKYVKKQDKNSISFLERLLDNGNMVILQTVFERISFYQKYDPEFDFKDYFQGEANHANIVLFHEEDKFYFVDKLPYCVNKNFVPYKDNKSIGVASKSDFEEACNFFMRCYTIDMDVQQLKNKDLIKSDINSFILEMTNSYTGTVKSKEGYTLYHGIIAWEKLIEFCEKRTDLKNYFHTQGWTMYDRICFDIWMLHSSRLILLEYLLQHKNSSRCNENFSLLINTLVKSINQIKLLEKAMAKRVISRISLLDDKICVRVKDILQIENLLNELLKNFVNN